MITDKDLLRSNQTIAEARAEKATENVTQIDRMLQPFDPEQDVNDRRILYEVTSMRLYRDEFLEEASFNSDEEG